MAGYNLTASPISDVFHSDDELWSAINTVFHSKSKRSTSYKFCFFKAMLDNIFNVDVNFSLPFYVVFERFTEIYWNLIIKFKLAQMPGSKLTMAEKLISSCASKYSLSDETSFIALREDIKLELCKAMSKECSRFVVGAFCEDTGKIFYGFSKKEQIIRFNPSAYAFLCKFSYLLTKLNYFEWAKYLENINVGQASVSITTKLDVSTKRDNLGKYSDFLLNTFGQHTCFYCSRELGKKCEVDHFIPWSFVHDDKLWNFVQSCRQCNNTKRDRLAPKMFAAKLIKRNEVLQKNVSLLDGFKNDFDSYKSTKITEMYDSAKFNGFIDDWQP